MLRRPRVHRALTMLLAALSAALVLTVFLVPRRASAAIGIAAGYPIRVGTPHRDAISVAAGNTNNLGINRATCLSTDTRYQFIFQSLATTGVAFTHLEVWARNGSAGSCADLVARTTTRTCWKVASFLASDINLGHLVEIPDAAIVAAAQNQIDVPDSPPIDRTSICSPTYAQEPTTVSLQFILTNGGAIVGDATSSNAYESSWPTTYDLRGPDAPTGVSVGPGETLLVAHWDNSTAGATNVKGFQAYCVKTGATGLSDAGDASSTTDTTAATDTTPAADTSDAGVDSGETDPDAAVDSDMDTDLDSGVDTAVATDSATSTTDADDTLEAGVATPPRNCKSITAIPTTFATGLLPPPEVAPCSDPTNGLGTKIQIDGLEDDQEYAVAIAGIDFYDNPGPLSEIVCGIPVETTDFFDAYKDAGGGGGGGYCDFGTGTTGASAAAGLVAFIGLALAIRRARKDGETIS